MNPSTRRRIQLIAVVGTMVLALGAGSMNLTGLRGGLEVQGVTARDGGLAVVVANLSPVVLSGTVTVQASASTQVVATAPVTVPGGGVSVVFVELPAPFSGGVKVGVVLDDGAPF